MSEAELRQFLLAVVALLSAAHFTGYLFHRFGMPKVVGEIVGGALLGKSFLGSVWPVGGQWLFHGFAAADKLLSAFYWLGLILLMFLSGFGLRHSIEREDRRLLAWLVAGTTTIPFVAGWAATEVFDLSALTGPNAHPVAFSIVVGIAFAVTSVPVISRIFIDLGILETRFARVVLAAAISHDVLLWGFLAVATGLAVGVSEGAPQTVVGDILRVAAFFLVTMLVGPRLLPWISKRRLNLVRKASPMGYALLICLLFAVLASLLKVNVIFGALMAGVLFGSFGEKEFEQVREKIADFSFAFFVPLYFAMVGYKLDLVNELDIGFTVAFFCAAYIVQMAATIASARIAGQGWRPAVNLGVAMNTRGGPGIVLATVALEFGIINGSFYSTLLLLAVLTSLAAGIWFRRQLRAGQDMAID